jgi:hypothetical protein
MLGGGGRVEADTGGGEKRQPVIGEGKGV